MSWLFCVLLLWRLCSFSSEHEITDTIGTALFALSACYFCAYSKRILLASPILKWWLIYGISLLALWPFWDNAFAQVLKYPILFSPVFIAVAVYAAPQDIQKKLLVTILLAGCLHGVACLWQFFVVYPQLLIEAQELQLTKAQIFRLEQGRTLGLGTSPDLAAMICLAALFMGAALFRTETKHRPILLVSSVIAFCGLALTRSTGGLLSVFVGLGVILFLSRKQKSAFNLLLPTLLLFVSITFIIGFRGIDALQTSSQERWLNWEGTLAIIQNHLLPGVGPGGFPASYEFYRPIGSNITRFAHSFPLQLTAELGIVGLGLSLFIYAYLFKRILLRSKQPGGNSKNWVYAAVTALWTHNLIDYGFSHPQTVSLLALATLLPSIDETKEEPLLPPAIKRYQLGLLIIATMLISYSLSFAAQRNTVLANSRNLNVSVSPLSIWVSEYPKDYEAQIALMSRAHYEQTHCETDCATWKQKSKDLADLWEAKSPAIATGWLLAAQIAHNHGDLPKTLLYINRALDLHPGMPQAWKFKLATFSHDPNYATWYKEASQWLHGTYQLKGFKRP